MIKFSQVTKDYRLGSAVYSALKGMSFEIRAGEAVAIMGPSGSGKTTTMNIIGLLDRPTSGDYFLNQQRVSQLSPRRMAALRNQTIGFVFQSFHLLPRLSAFQNIALPVYYSNQPIDHLHETIMFRLEQLGMADYAHRKPNELSGGQQQRIAIARALVNDPPVILADEPTGALDSKTSQQIMEVLLAHQSKRTVVIITHDHSVAQLCPRTIDMCDGVVQHDV
jgi:putative ABC transport system ATP-binding protein